MERELTQHHCQMRLERISPSALALGQSGPPAGGGLLRVDSVQTVSSVREWIAA